MSPAAALLSITYAPDAKEFKPTPNRLLNDLSDNESRGYRLTWLITAAVVIALFGYMTLRFWAPAHPGVDQNGYLVGGRQFSKTLSTKFVPKEPYEYVGNMWVMVGDKDGTYYPKYPLGLPILYAIMLWVGRIGGGNHGLVWAFYVSPAGMIAAVAGMFFLARVLAGSFAGLLAAILLATSQVTLVLANNPNSHASCTALVVWGMLFLLQWWQTNSFWRGLLAGFFLGYACMIRYTEGLLILPIAFAVVCTIRWTQWRSYLRAAVPLLGWLVPVGYLLVFNKIAMGSWTGYDTTNESGFAEGSFWHNFWYADAGKAAFTWAKVVVTWEQVVRTFHDTGMLFTFPLALAGVAMVFRRSWQYGVVLVLWLVPGILLYASYYWSPDRGVSYARFFVTFFPAFALGVAVCIRHGIIGSDDFGIRRRSIVTPIAAGIVVAAAAGVGVYRACNGLEDGVPVANQSLVGMHRSNLSLSVAGDVMAKSIPGDAVVFADGPRMAEGLMNYAQFMGTYQLFQFNAFTDSAMRAFLARKEPDPNDPNPLQPRRREYLAEVYKGKTLANLLSEQQRIVKQAFSTGQRVFLIGTKASVLAFQNQFFPASQYEAKFVTRWSDQVEPMFGSTEAPKPPESRRGAFGANPRRQPGPLGPNARGGFNEWTSSAWQLVEVIPRTPALATQPTTQPK